MLPNPLMASRSWLFSANKLWELLLRHLIPHSLLSLHPKFDAEIKKALSTFENLLKEFDLKQKEGKFLALEKNFSPEFQKKFLKENLLKESDMKQKEEKARKDLK